VNFINDIKELKELVFVGGEPLIYKKLINGIISQISPLIRKTIITNGVLADQDFINSIKETNTHIVFSIDTLDKDFWKFVRGNDSFDRVFANFYYALDNLEPTQISVQSVLSKETKDHIEKVGKWLNELGIYHSIQDYVSDGFGGHWTELALKKVKSNSMCQAHKNNMSIMPNGDIYTCFQQQLITGCVNPLGNIMNDSFEQIISSEYFCEVIQKMKVCNLPCKVLKCNIE
jgi:radical SAM protein with 4Fe4S-binding SPASM domain